MDTIFNGHVTGTRGYEVVDIEITNYIDERTLVSIGVFVLLFAIFYLSFAAINYILNSAAYYRIMSRSGLKAAWLAWIPVVNSYAVGRVANEHDKRNGHSRMWHITLIILAVLKCIFFIAVGVMVSEIFNNVLDKSSDMIELLKDVLSSGKISLYEFFYNSETLIFMEESLSEIMELFTDLSVIMPLFVCSILASVLGMAYKFCRTICVYKAFEFTVPKRALAYLLLDLFVPLAGSICLYACSGVTHREKSVADVPGMYAAEVPTTDYYVQPADTTQFTTIMQPVASQSVAPQNVAPQSVEPQPVASQSVAPQSEENIKPAGDMESGEGAQQL